MKFWFTQGMSFCPVFVVVWTYLTFGISYIISVARGDVDPGFPYISDTGARRPESSIFGQMLNITAAVALLTLYVRYKQVTHYLVKLPDHKLNIVYYTNRIAMVLACFICFGISLVANFQETSVLSVHVVGALLAFVGGTVYMYMQALISYKMCPEVNNKTIWVVRLAMAAFGTLCIILEFLCTRDMKQPKLHWHTTDPDFKLHITSTVGEWLLAASFLAFFLTFIRDFQKISLSAESEVHSETLHHSININAYVRPEERTPLIS